MLSKSYSLLNFLNRSHSPSFRYGVGGAAYAGTFSVTGRPSIARLVRTQFVQDETKYAFRLAGWVLRRGWPGVETVTDDFFDFTLGATPADLEALEGFIAARRAGLPEHLWRADDLFVRAARIHAQLDAGARDIEALRADFREHADALLPLISSAHGGDAGPVSEREGDFSVDDARTALHDLAEALPVQQWRWYVISGTFLGIVREGGFLAHDYDVDVGVTFDPDHPEVLDGLVEALEASPHYVVKKLDTAKSCLLIFCSHSRLGSLNPGRGGSLCVKEGKPLSSVRARISWWSPMPLLARRVRRRGNWVCHSLAACSEPSARLVQSV